MTIEAPPQRQTLLSVQALRGIAALLVVLFHAAEIWRGLSGSSAGAGFWDRGWAGVDLFFVISGFVMVWVAGDRSAGWRSSARFLFDRVTRIYPLWWVFCALMAIYFFITYGQPATPDRYGQDTALGALLQSMALWPTGELPVLTVGWTLTFELAFYALFAGLLLLPVRARMPLILIWGVVLLAIWVRTDSSPVLPQGWQNVLLSPLCLEFVFGAGMAYLLRRVTVPRIVGSVGLYVGGIAFLGLLIAGDALAELEGVQTRVMTFGLAATVLLGGVVAIERNGGMAVPPFLQAIGDASYTLYLSHLLVLLALRRLVEPLGIFSSDTPIAMGGFMALGVTISVLASLIGYRVLERPLLRISRMRLTVNSARP